MLCFGRVFLGFAGGLCYVAGPIYVNEIATPGIRGMLGFSHQVMLSAGLWTASAVALSLVTWRLLSFIALVPTIAYYFLLQSIPESPYFLIKTGQIIDLFVINRNNIF
jgi:MFS family permease